MDPNTSLLLAKTEQTTRWEDEEKASYGIAELRAEFRRRLYGDDPPREPANAAAE